jgi:hypothetical protein
MNYAKTIILVGIGFGVGRWTYKKLTKINLQTPNLFFLQDSDIDQTSSVLVKLTSSDNNAFSNPTIFCDLIDKVPEDQTIKLVINTNGGPVVHCAKMLRKLKKHKAGYIVYIKNNCYSAGTIVALGAKEIVFYKDSMLGKIDPQNSSHQQMAIFLNLDEKYITDTNMYDVTEAKYMFNYMKELLDLLFPEVGNPIREKVTECMLKSAMPHFKAFGFEECQAMGLPVREAQEDEISLFEYDGNITNYQSS